MRVSTVTMFEQSVSAMNHQQSEFLRVGQQLATGRAHADPEHAVPGRQPQVPVPR